MIRVSFKNLQKSEIAAMIASERLEAVAERFPDLERSTIQLTLSMENSPLQAGPDRFTVKIHVHGGRYSGVTLEKSAPDLYQALADVIEHTLERLNRFGDRRRVKERSQSRKVASDFKRVRARPVDETRRMRLSRGGPLS
jgi:ribosome-associated translation inhibitor RaiA